MWNPNLPESDLLKTLLDPLLDDFQYWFGQSCVLLESQDIGFLGDANQADLLARVKQAQQEVSTTQMLLKLTDNQVGVETPVLMSWHQLVTECWKVAIRVRLENSAE
jgi:Protein of unknown function (DUF2605)